MFGEKFWGTRDQDIYSSLQTPLYFRRMPTGGMQNESFMLIHYTKDNGLESITY